MKPYIYNTTSNPIAMLTTYDAPTAALAVQSAIDILLVGDSLGPNMLGYTSVQEVTLDDMCHHISAVRRGAPDAYILGDLPFVSVQDSATIVASAQALIAAGADSVKLETEASALDMLSLLHGENIPVCAHIGYTPQTTGLAVKAQGKEINRAKELIEIALETEKRGAFMIVLELMPSELSALITDKLTIPTIGIGAGPFCSGQVQVLYDILGYGERIFKHTKRYKAVQQSIGEAFTAYSTEVHSKQFPTLTNATTLDGALLSQLEDMYV